MPTIPPSEDSTMASTRNCNRTSRSSAPMARRMPISRVRSVTDTNMMFIMPMPPTSKLTAATAPSSIVNTRVVPLNILAISFRSITEKSSSSLADIWRRSRSNSVTACSTFWVDTPSLTDIWISLTS